MASDGKVYSILVFLFFIEFSFTILFCDVGVKNHQWNGLFQSASNEPPNGTWGNGGDFDYTHLKQEIMPFYERYWDDQAKVPFLFNRTTGHWISYEDLESLKWKTDYIKQHQLAGIFFWEITKDREADLISAAFNSLIKDRNTSSIYHCRRHS